MQELCRVSQVRGSVSRVRTRRDFLKTAGAAAAVPLLGARSLDALERRLEPFARQDAKATASDQAFWDEIRRLYPVPEGYVHLENGFSSPQPAPTFEAFAKYSKHVNDNLSYYARREAQAEEERVYKELAELAGVPVEELLITRNTTESLGTVIHGITWKPGDAAIVADLDYSSMIQQFRQERTRHGVELIGVTMPLHPTSEEQIVSLYERSITPRTKAILLTHLNNITGLIIPVRKIADMARARGVMTIIDSAHAFAHLDYKVPDLGGDFLGASLHKWLSTPVGNGLLHVRKDRIASIWPLMGDATRPVDDITKLDRRGTRPMWNVLAISDAIRFHNMIGAARKEARLRWAQEYWTSRVADFPGVKLNTPRGPHACAIANVAVAGLTPQELSTRLWDDHRIYVQTVTNPSARGIRVTPHLYTTTAELDQFVTAMRVITRA